MTMTMTHTQKYVSHVGIEPSWSPRWIRGLAFRNLRKDPLAEGRFHDFTTIRVLLYIFV
jgi:hypothetical protein